MVTAMVGVSPQVSPSLLRPCALQGGVNDSALTGLNMTSSDGDLAKDIAWLLENIEVFNAECAILFNSGSRPRTSRAEDAMAAAGLFADECLPGEELHLITQRLIFRLGCRDPGVLARIGEIFSLTVSSYQSDGGIGVVEFRGYVAALLTQALREMEEKQMFLVEEEKATKSPEACEDNPCDQGLRRDVVGTCADFTIRAAGLTPATASLRPISGEDSSQELLRRNVDIASQSQVIGDPTPPPLAPTLAVHEAHSTQPALVGNPRENCEVPSYTGQVAENTSEVKTEVAQTTTWRERLSSVQQSLLSGLDAFADKCDSVFAPGEQIEPPAVDLPIGGAVESRKHVPPACQMNSDEHKQASRSTPKEPPSTSDGVAFCAAPSGGRPVPAMQSQLSPQQRLEIEGRRALKTNGLALYCFEGQTWIPKRALLSRDRRSLFILEAEGVPQLEECACFRLLEMRQMTRRTAPGRHLLSLHFEDGTVLLRFSYPEFLAAMIATVLADRRIPLVEGRWDD